jgi:hypothetical protein
MLYCNCSVPWFRCVDSYSHRNPREGLRVPVRNVLRLKLGFWGRIMLAFVTRSCNTLTCVSRSMMPFMTITRHCKKWNPRLTGFDLNSGSRRIPTLPIGVK